MNMDMQEKIRKTPDANGKRALNREEQLKVAGGNRDEFIGENALQQDTYCYGAEEEGKHQWVRTGNTREESFLIFWTVTYTECRCAKCSYTRWEKC